MSGATAWPAFRFRVALDSDPLDSTPTHTDFSTRLKSFSHFYGKESASDEFQPGTSVVVLEDSDRALDPLNTSSTYNGKLIPRRRCVLDATYNGTSYDLFTTFNDAFPHTYSPPARSDVVLSGTDLTSILRGIGLPETVALLEFAVDPCYVWWRLNEEVGTTAADKSGNGRTAELPYPRSDNVDNVAAPAFASGDPLVTYDSSRTMALVGGLASSGADPPVLLLTDLPTALPVTFETMLIHDVSVDTHLDLLIRGEFSGTGIFCDLLGSASAGATDFIIEAVARVAGTGRRALTDYVNLTDQPHILAVTFEAADCTIYLDGADITDSNSVASSAPDPASYIAIGGGKPGFPAYAWWDGRLGDVRIYEGLLSPTRIAAHADAALTPWTGDTAGERIQRIADYCNLEAGDLDIATGHIILGPTGLGGDAFSYMEKVALTEDGPLFVEARNGGKLTFYDAFERWTATRSTTSQATFTDDPAAGGTPYRFNGDDITINDGVDQVINIAIVQWDQGEIRVEDAASILTYGPKSRTYDTAHKTANEAQTFGEMQIALHKDAHARIETLSLDPAADPALWPIVLGTRYGDRISFRFKPQDTGSVIGGDYWVQGVRLEGEQGVNHCLAQFYLTPAEDVQAFILDSSLLDGSDVLVA